MTDRKPMRAYAVLGPWRGGTSAVTGVLNALGVYVGRNFFEANTDYCTFEDASLRTACLDCFDERPGQWRFNGSVKSRVRKLRNWIETAIEQTRAANSVAVGGKHPVMCKLVPELTKAWQIPGKVEFVPVSVIRSVDDVRESWTRNDALWWPRADRESAIAQLIGSRDLAMTMRRHVQVDFDALRLDTHSTVLKLARDCGLCESRVEQAVQSVRPTA